MFVTEDLKVSVGICLTQCLQCWQSQNKITNRTAADRENAVHIFLQRPLSSAANFDPSRRHGGHYSLISRQRECENHAAINERDCMQETPAENAARAPVDFIAKQVRDRNPKQTGNDQ